MYDKDRRLIQTNFPSGRKIKNIYTEAQLTRIQTPQETIDLSYGCGGKVASMNKGGKYWLCLRRQAADRCDLNRHPQSEPKLRL